MKKIILNELNNNKRYLSLVTLISTLTIIPQLVFSPSLKHTILMFFTFILLVLIPKFSKIIFSVFIIFLNLSNILIGHIFIHWSYTIADISPRIEAAILSPSYETFEYLLTYIDYKDIFLVFYSLSIIFLLYKFLKHYTHSFKILKPIAISLSLLIIISISLNENPIKKIEPFSIPDKCIVIIKNKKYGGISIQRKHFLQNAYHAKNVNNSTIYDKIVVIMGESANKHHMKIYGYDKNTTPFLSSLKNQNYFYSFNAIAPTNQTRYSLPIDLTKANVHNFLDTYLHSVSIITDFKINNYKTYWISNQGRVGKYDSYTSSMADEANVQIFANMKYSRATTDDVILKYLDEFKLNTHKEMFLIHLIGSHGSYEKRYPEDFALNKNAKTITEKYDNTIYYTDYILNKIYNRFKNKKLLLIYISDHAEVVNKDKHGHGFLPPFRDEYDVPFVIYSNVKNIRLDEISKDNDIGYFNLENFNNIVKYISGISNDKNISFSNEIFALDPKNMFDYSNLKFYNENNK